MALVANMTSVKRARTEASSLVRSIQREGEDGIRGTVRSVRGFQHVADAAHRVDHR